MKVTTRRVFHIRDAALPVFVLPSLKPLVKTTLFCVFAFMCGTNVSRCMAADWYVKGSVAQSSDGKSWPAAFKTIQEGIDAASEGDTVTVARGPYRENVSFRGDNIVLRSTNPLDLSVVENTIIDGRGLGSVVSFSGKEDETCELAGFTIRNGSAERGAGVWGGTWGNPTRASILNNIIEGNVVPDSVGGRGGGLYYCNGRIQGNIIRGNSCESIGGGLCECHGVVQSNIIIGNRARLEGGGLCFCDATIKNNLICGNSAATGGGLVWCNGTIQNNTIVRNSVNGTGSGLSECLGTIRNCIIWNNPSGDPWPPIPGPEHPQILWSSIPTYSCIQDWDDFGQGNIGEDPGFADAPGGDFRLREDSPCIGAGLNYYWFSFPERDADGNCRLAGQGVDMGCFEYGASRDWDGDLLSDAHEGQVGTDPHGDDTDGDSLRDGLEVLRGTDPLAATPPRIVHVPSDVPTIQQCLCLGRSGDEIVVATGLYRENLQFCGPDVILRSSEPQRADVVAATILDGNGVGQDVLPLAEGCRGPTVSFVGWENEACVLAGFTIRNGRSAGGGGIRGGTPAYHTRATIRGNVVTKNSAPATYGYGGGLVFCDGSVRNNTITENRAERHGGLSDCCGTIQGNIVSQNWAWDTGGGLARCHGVIRNNLIVGNSAGGYGGGLYECSGTIENNTVCGNKGHQGGGLNWCEGTIRNSIVWGNSTPQLGYRCDATYCCVQGGVVGQGNISANPLFADPDGPDNKPETYNDNDYRLQAGSPCIDAGLNQDWMWSAVDLAGNPRITNGTVDIGAYEFLRAPWVTITQEEDVVTLRWGEFADGRYTVQWRDDLVQGMWQNAPGTWPLSDLMWLDIIGGEVLQRFYRLECAGVYSDPVGFVKVFPVDEGFTMVSVPFIAADRRLNGNRGCIGDMIAEALTGGPSAEDADIIWKWDATTQSYAKAYLVAGKGQPYDGKWWDDDTGGFSTMRLNVGECCWILRRPRRRSSP